MKNLSRRDFGKAVATGAVGGLTASSGSSLSGQTRGTSSSVKRMTTALRELIAKHGIIVSPAAYDPLSARLAERVGFNCLDQPGNAMGVFSCIPEPALSLGEVAQLTLKITAAVNIPVVVDVGAGYGEPAHVYRTIRVMEQVGAAGMHIEDQIVPKRFHYHVGVEHTIPAEAMVDKIHAAVEGRRDADFVIIARTDAVRTNSFAEAVRRSNRYLEAGADVAMLYPETLEDIQRTPKEVHGPVNWGYSTKMTMGEGICPSLQDLETWGYKMMNYAHVPELAAYKAMKDALVQLKTTGTVKLDRAVYEPLVAEFEELEGLPTYIRIETETVEKGK